MPRSLFPDRARLVLGVMTPGTTYTTSEVATATGLRAGRTREVLERLTHEGGVKRIEPVWRGLAVNWQRR